MRAASPAAGQALARAARNFGVDSLRADFPILRQTVNGKPLVYLDNAASSQKPQSVIEAVSRFYRESNSNVHRGVHTLSQKATTEYENARSTVKRFIKAGSSSEIVFVRGTTEAINLVAGSFGQKFIGPGDEVVISHMEHHSNIVPWQMLCEARQAQLRVVPIDDSGQIILEEYEKLLCPRTRLVAMVHVSNALGTVVPVEAVIEMAHQRGIPVLLDGAQAVPHQSVDVAELDCDFYCFSSHKMFGPTGVGALYAKKSWLEKMPPYQGGGDMIRSVSFERTIYNDLPFRFEAGTPNIAAAVGLATAIDYLENVGLDKISQYEKELVDYASETLAEIPRLRLIGTAQPKASVVSFILEGIHAHDVGTILDQEGIAIRTGHHCAQPLMERYGVPATARASMALYNTREEIDALAAGLLQVVKVLG